MVAELFGSVGHISYISSLQIVKWLDIMFSLFTQNLWVASSYFSGWICSLERLYFCFLVFSLLYNSSGVCGKSILTKLLEHSNLSFWKSKYVDYSIITKILTQYTKGWKPKVSSISFVNGVVFFFAILEVGKLSFSTYSVYRDIILFINLSTIWFKLQAFKLRY